MELLIIFRSNQMRGGNYTHHLMRNQSTKINYFELIFKVARLITFTTLLITSIQQLNGIIKISFWKILHFHFKKQRESIAGSKILAQHSKIIKVFVCAKRMCLCVNECECTFSPIRTK